VDVELSDAVGADREEAMALRRPATRPTGSKSPSISMSMRVPDGDRPISWKRIAAVALASGCSRMEDPPSVGVRLVAVAGRHGRPIPS
jgi:hypothetical protein